MVDKKRKITRHRVSYSCRNCRKRKVKCDKAQPTCGECLKIHESCVYDTSDNVEHDLPQSSAKAAATQKRKQDSGEDTEYRDNTAQAIIDHRVRIEDPGHDKKLVHHEVGATAESGDSISVQPGRQRSDESSSPAGNRVRASVAGTTSLQYDTAGSDDNHLSDLSPSSEQDELASSNPTLTSIAQQLEELNLRINLRTDSHVPVSSYVGTSIIRPSTTAYRSNNDTSGAENYRDTSALTHALIPAEGQRNAIFRSWLTAVYTVLPILEPVEALIRYEAFHQWYRNGVERGKPNPVKNYMPMIHTIHYGGTMSLPVSALRRWWPGASRRSLLSFMRSDFQKSLDSVQPCTKTVLRAMVMMRYMSKDHDDRLQSGATIAYMIRAAQSLGLHRNNAQGNVTLGSECDRRLWWEIVNLDTATASSINLPPLLNEHYYDETLPNDAKEYLVGSSEGIAHQKALESALCQTEDADDPESSVRTSVVSVHNLIFRSRSLVSSTTRKFLSASTGSRLMGMQDMASIKRILGNIDREMRTTISRIPAKGAPELDFEPMPDKTGSPGALDYGSSYGDRLTLAEIQYLVGEQPVMEGHQTHQLRQLRKSTVLFHRWARIALSMLLDQIHCISYAPFIKNGKSKMWTMSRHCALKHCHSFMRKYCSLAANEDFECFRWTWTALFQPTHACMLLLIDVYERPHSQEAARSRALFDEMLSLSSQARDIVGGKDGTTWAKPLQEGGLEAWAMFHQVRAKAWRKAGLDPTVLWTEEDQIQVGLASPPDEVERFARSMREDLMFPTGDRLPKDTPENLGPLYRKVISKANGELRHPSDASVLPDSAEDQLCPFETKDKPPANLLRARSDQEVLSLEVEQDWYRVPQEEDSNLQHVSQLIDKIRASQQQQQQQQRQHIPGESSDTGTTIEPSRSVFANPERLTNVDDSDFISDPALDLHDPDDIFPSVRPAEEQQQDEGEEQSSSNLNIDIDWAQWDSVFGHFTTGFEDSMDLDLDFDFHQG